MADIPAPSCTSELRTVMRPINQIYHALEANNFELLSVQYESFLKAVDSINAVCTPGIQRMMFQMRLTGVSCQDKLETVLAKVQEFENSEVATDDDIIRISTFILSHMPSLQTLCASNPTEEQVPVVEPAQVQVVEVAAPAIVPIENPIAYQGFSDDTPAVETVEAAPQQETASEDPYALTEAELQVIANILPHTPYGGAQVQIDPTTLTQPKQTQPVSDGLDDLTRTELGMLANILPHDQAPSVPAAQGKVDVETANKVNERINNLMGALLSGSAPAADQTETWEVKKGGAPTAASEKLHELMNSLKGSAADAGQTETWEVKKGGAPTATSQKLHEMMDALKSGSTPAADQTETWEVKEGGAPTATNSKLQEMIEALKGKSAPSTQQSQVEQAQRVDAPSASSTAKMQEIIEALKGKSAPSTQQSQVEQAQKVDAPSASSNAKIQELMDALKTASPSASEQAHVVDGHKKLEGPMKSGSEDSTVNPKLQEIIEALKGKSASSTQQPQVMEAQKVDAPTAGFNPKLQEIIDALKPKSAPSTQESQVVEAQKVEASTINAKIQELMDTLKSESEQEQTSSDAKVQEIMDTLKSSSEPATEQAQEVEASTVNAKINEIMDTLKSESEQQEQVVEVAQVEAPTLSSVYSQLVDAIHKTQAQVQQATKIPEVPALPARFGTQIGSKITPTPGKPPVPVTVAENKKTSDLRPECLSTVYGSLDTLYLFFADAVAGDIKQLESAYKSLESITNGINSYCVPTITRDEAFSGAGDCPNTLQTIKDIITKFKKHGATDYLNVVDTIQNLWSVHKAFVNDCVNNPETQATQEPAAQTEQPEGIPSAITAPQNKCELQYSIIVEKLVKMADNAVEENLTEVFNDMEEMKESISKINRYCELRYRIAAFPLSAFDKGTCDQDFVNMRQVFVNAKMGSLDDLVETTRNVWYSGLHLLHDC